ncbi:unnamed protein product [Chrysoparadoxa australica]
MEQLPVTRRIQTLSRIIASALEKEEQSGDGCKSLRADINALKEKGCESTVNGLPDELLQGDLELAFRSYQARMLSKMMQNGKPLADSGIQNFLSLAMSYSGAEAQEGHALTGRLPCLLLEDLLEGLSTENCKLVWTWLEGSISTLTSEAIFSNGKLILLRLCNRLLRKLSKMHDTEFCGRVLMFLASAYKLSERSAVNVAGHKDLGNITVYEEEAEFKAALEPEGSKAGSSSKSTHVATGDSALSDGKDNFPIDYSLYRTFWGLHSLLMNPVPALKQAEAFEALVSETGKVLAAFEGNAFSERDVLLAREKRSLKLQQRARNSSSAGTDEMQDVDEDTPDAAAAQATYFGCKYLTNSRLLRLQLQDPTIRLQIITQVLLMFHTLEAAFLGGKAVSDRIKPEEELRSLRKRARALVEHTPPSGREHLAMLDRVLMRETNWLDWKAEGCLAYEKLPPKEVKGKQELVGRRSKRKRGSDRPKPYTRFETQDLQNLSTELRGKVPTMDQHLEHFIDCMDPEAGIEEQYHPKHDKLYCWRALRLVATERLDLFEVMPDGSLEKGVLKLTGKTAAAATTPKSEPTVAEDGEVS